MTKIFLITSLKKYLKCLGASLVPALIVLVPGTLLTLAQRAVYAGLVFIPLTALLLFLLVAQREKTSPAAILANATILIVAHFILVGFALSSLKYFIIYLVAASLGTALGLLARKLK